MTSHQYVDRTLDAKLEPPEWRYKLWLVVVAVDPSVTSHESSDETGIVVAGLDWQNRCYILEDLSGKMTPDEWGLVAVRAALRWGARKIVCEVNQGGDLVLNVLLSINKNIPVEPVRATKGKRLRAEPVCALYEQGKIFHVMPFDKLEKQMVEWTSDTKDSPDRLDAMVYAVTDLMLAQRPTVVRYIPEDLSAA